MNLHYTYLLIDIGALLFPLLASFERKVAFYKSWRHLFPAMFITAALFIGWDILSAKRGIWWFNADYTLPFRLAGLPVEEWLFFLFIPYSCVFIYACLQFYFPGKKVDKGWPWMIGLGIGLFVVAFLNFGRAYSLTAFGGCGLGLVITYLLRHKMTRFRADTFLIAYTVCLIPFSIVNGLLTALPVVLYNDAENVGIRLYTIPVEDVFYGMLLILGSIWGMCALQQKQP
jgi:lycopene cyclase domain-containing protein